LRTGSVDGDVVGQQRQVGALGGCNLLDQPVKLPPAVAIVSARQGARRAKVQKVEFMVAAHDSPVAGAHQVDHRATEGDAVDQVPVEHDRVGLKPLQFDEHRLQCRQVAVNIRQ
jgi:hypothetical protein